MTLVEYLEKKHCNKDITFVIAKPIKTTDNHYKLIYDTTPIRTCYEWKMWAKVNSYIVLNADHPPIDITGNWNGKYNRMHLDCCLIMKPEDIIKQYGEKQGKEMITYYEETVTL